MMREFFNPRAVAVVGASRDPDKIGHVIVKNLLGAGFKGKIFPVNPNAGTILGLKTYKSVLDIPGEVETAIIAVPARLSVQVAEECGKKGVKGLIVVTAGFSEVGEERLSAGLFKVVRKYGMRMVGPNFPGIEISTLGGDSDGLRSVLIRMLGGKRGGLTVIGPSKLIRQIKKDPTSIHLFTKNR